MPKKSLGQNFLKSSKAISDIVSAGNIKDSDLILEIGPGKGALTEKLLETGVKVICIEKDRDLIPTLEEKFSNEIKNRRLEIIEGDVLDLNPSELFKNKKYKIIANIPYYITGALLRKFLSDKNPPSLMVVLVQKEVAERIVSRDGKESILSMSVRFYGDPKYMGKVSARYFSPEPKVDSAIILIDNISKDKIKGVNDEDFFDLVKQAFGQKRKTLIKNLSKTFKNKEELLKIFLKLGISEKVRAENLSFDSMISLAKALFPLNSSWKKDF
jgi:16S rRNA (adenine1518-N6/adenine1519-N6)-dimethyltransferase